MKRLRAKPSRRAWQAASTACRGPVGRRQAPCHVTRSALPQGLITVTSHGLTSATADASVQFITSQATSRIDDSLRTWVSSNGGYIHTSLRLVDVASCGCRGIVATAPISFADAAEQPVIIVPESLYLSSDGARELLAAADSQRSGFGLFRSKPEPLPGTVAVALALAVERARGEDSFWRPYVASLPSEVQCGWALHGSQLASILEELEARGIDRAKGWADEVRQARAGVERWARRAVEQYGKLLPAKVDVDDMVWAMSQVGLRDGAGLPCVRRWKFATWRAAADRHVPGPPSHRGIAEHTPSTATHSAHKLQIGHVFHNLGRPVTLACWSEAGALPLLRS